MKPLKIAVIGAGLIGKSHIALINQSVHCELAAIVDPAPEAKDLAQSMNASWYVSLDALLSGGSNAEKVDGVIIASPNQLHVAQALACLTANIPCLIEKPVADNLVDGKRLLEAVKQTNIPMLVGHHRMHSRIMTKAKQLINDGALGDLVSVNGSALFYKPDDYFEKGPWRTKPGGGPILINMIHEVGNLRYLCGEISSVLAIASSARRGFAVEDTAAILFAFSNGMVGTFTLSDTAASPCSWEQTSKENKSYASYDDENCYHIAGTQGSLSIPTMRLKQYGTEQKKSWWEPFECATVSIEDQDPLVLQLNHFCKVILREALPLVTVHDGLENLRVTEAIADAASSGQCIQLN